MQTTPSETGQNIHYADDVSEVGHMKPYYKDDAVNKTYAKGAGREIIHQLVLA